MTDLLKQTFARRFRSSDPIPKNKPFTHVIRMRITEEEFVECGLLSNGTFVVISGPTGVGKSSIMAMLAGATWNNEFGNMVYKGNPNRKRTLWIDTEMPETDFKYFQRDVVLKMMDIQTEEDALWAINLTWLKEMEDKRQVVFDLFTALGQGGTIPDGQGGFYDLSEVGLVVFDGIVDIIPNTTDETQAKRDIEEFKHFIEKANIPCVTVLHSDKKGNDLRGTFGTFLGQKASGTIMIKAKHPGEPALVRAHKGVRGTRPFKPFEIKWSTTTGMPYVDQWEQSVDDLKDLFGVSKPMEATSQPKSEYNEPI